MIELCDRILAGEEGRRDCSSATYNAETGIFPIPKPITGGRHGKAFR